MADAPQNASLLLPASAGIDQSPITDPPAKILDISTARAEMFLRHARAEEMDALAAQLAAVQAEMKALAAELDHLLATRLNGQHVVWRDMTVLIMTPAEGKLYRRLCPKSYSFDYGARLLTNMLCFEIDEFATRPELAGILPAAMKAEFVTAVRARKQDFIKDKQLPRWVQRQLAERARGSFDKIILANPSAADLVKIYLPRKATARQQAPDLAKDGLFDVHHNLPQQFAQLASKTEARGVVRLDDIPLRPRCHNSPAVERLDDGYTIAPGQPGLVVMRRDIHGCIVHDYILDKAIDLALKPRGLSRRLLSIRGNSFPAKQRVVRIKNIPMFKHAVDITAADEDIMALYERYKMAQRQLRQLHKDLVAGQQPR